MHLQFTFLINYNLPAVSVLSWTLLAISITNKLIKYIGVHPIIKIGQYCAQNAIELFNNRTKWSY